MPGRVAHACNSHTWEAMADQAFRANMKYIMRACLKTDKQNSLSISEFTH